MNLKTIDDMGDITGRRVIVRADLNVPMRDGKITDATRIIRFAPTAKELSARGAKVIIMTHLGRPKGVTPEFTTESLADTLVEALNTPVTFVPDCIGDIVKTAVKTMQNGDTILLENVRFYPEEEENDLAFAEQLAENGDFFVNDAFSAAHRAHASTEGITRFLNAFAGLLMQEELDALSKSVNNPTHPCVAIVAGSKVSTKIKVLEHIAKQFDTMIIGGAMANTFLLAQGKNIGKSIAEPEMQDTARRIMDSAEEISCEIILPVDTLAATTLAPDVEVREIGLDDMYSDEMILDVGHQSVDVFKNAIANARTVLMNGPVGAFEVKPFDTATNAIVEYIADLTKAGRLISVAGGGDTVSAINNVGRGADFTYVSTAGGAFLEYLEGKTLPAIVPLEKK